MCASTGYQNFFFFSFLFVTNNKLLWNLNKSLITIISYICSRSQKNFTWPGVSQNFQCNQQHSWPPSLILLSNKLVFLRHNIFIPRVFQLRWIGYTSYRWPKELRPCFYQMLPAKIRDIKLLVDRCVQCDDKHTKLKGRCVSNEAV